MRTLTLMMQCGHAANGTDSEGRAVCVICTGITIEACLVDQRALDLSEREARCACGATRPSDPDLAFFEYRGPGSSFATKCRHCGYTKGAHDRQGGECDFCEGTGRYRHHSPTAPARHCNRCAGKGTLTNPLVCADYEPLTEGHEYDSFYSGCRGWD